MGVIEREGRGWRFACDECGKHFSVSYNMNQTRREKPKYCAPKCKVVSIAKRAEAGREARFWSKVDKKNADECWPWTAQLDQNGYGKFQWRHGEPWLAHRAAHFLATGQEPGDMDVCHSCDNPPCCNPNHLWLGTAKDNVADMIKKGRARRGILRGEKSSTARLTEAQAIEVYNSKEPVKDIARQMGISGTAVRMIKNGTNWAHATGARK